MVDWIKADDKSRDWPEGKVIAFYPNPSDIGSGSAVIAWRRDDGSFLCVWAGEAEPTHFFFMLPEPAK